MSRVEIIKELKKRNPKLNKSELETVLDIFCSSITGALKEEKKIEIRNFGNFFTKNLRENFNARNPATNELIYKPDRIKIRFRPSKYIKNLINE